MQIKTTIKMQTGKCTTAFCCYMATYWKQTMSINNKVVKLWCINKMTICFKKKIRSLCTHTEQFSKYTVKCNQVQNNVYDMLQFVLIKKGSGYTE